MKVNEFSIMEFIQIWNKDEEYIAFGGGVFFEIITDMLKDKLKIRYIIDNNIDKQGKVIKGAKVFSPEVLLNDDKPAKIIVMNDDFYKISKQLSTMGFKEDIDFVLYSKLVSVWKWFYDNSVYLMRTDIMVTERCTLNCRYCNMLMPYYLTPKDKEINNIKIDIDKYFNYVDYVVIFQIIGGEVFLHPDFYEILKYICTNYRNKIHTIRIVTNATIIPSKEILKLCSECNIIFQISDYTNTVKYKERIEKFIETLEEYNIKYSSIEMIEWVDFGSPLIKRNMSEKQLTTFFGKCRAAFRGLSDGKLYYCHLNYSAVSCGLVEDNKNDFFDLNTDKNDKEKFKLLMLDMGYTEKGYISFCENCYGCGDVNQRYVCAGEQCPRGEYPRNEKI